MSHLGDSGFVEERELYHSSRNHPRTRPATAVLRRHEPYAEVLLIPWNHYRRPWVAIEDATTARRWGAPMRRRSRVERTPHHPREYGHPTAAAQVCHCNH